MNVTQPYITTSDDSSVACYMFPNSTAKCMTLTVCKNVSAVLSAVGSLFTLGIIILFRKYKNFSQRLIVNLSVSALLHAVAIMVTDMNDSATALCVIQGASLMFAVSASCIWVIAIMMNIYWIVVFGHSLKNYEKALFSLCWLLPVVLMGAPFLGDEVYGPAGVWCWMKNDWKWRFGLWYIARILSVIVFIIVTIRLLYYIRLMAVSSRNVTDGGDVTAAKRDIRTLRLYPVAYFVLSIFSIINRIHNAVDGSQTNSEHVFPLVLLQTIVGPLFGAVLGLVFLLDPRTRRLLNKKKIKEAFQTYCKTTGIFEYPISGVTTTSCDTQTQ